MKIPKKLNILGCKWKINVDKLDKALGECNQKNRTILLHEDCSNPDRFYDSFYHEITHALLMSSTSFSLATNEQVVVPLSKAIRDFTNQMIKIQEIK